LRGGVILVAVFLAVLVVGILSVEPPTEETREIVLILDRTELRGERLLHYKIINRVNGSISFGEPYDIQLRRDGAWESVEWLRDRVWIAILWRLEPGQSISRPVELPVDIEAGTYRLVKEVILDDSGEKVALTAVFWVLS